jgi:hypothetical protein
MAKPGTGATKIMRGKFFNGGGLGILTHDPPDDLLAYA